MAAKEEKEIKMPIFRERFSSLRGDMTQAKFAEFIGISRPTVGFYENGERLPDAIVLKQIAEKCSVSADWLIGLSDVKTTDGDIKSICEYTGLSEESVDVLNRSKKYNHPYIYETINILLKQCFPPSEGVTCIYDNHDILKAIAKYLFVEIKQDFVKISHDGDIIIDDEFETNEMFSYINKNDLETIFLIKIQNILSRLKEKNTTENNW